jgi:ABC-2 type transport system permease protein
MESADMALPSEMPQARRFGAVNWRGVWTLYAKEVRRFLNVYTQTIVAPVATTLMFLAVFALALGRAVQEIGGVPFVEFLAPGLIVMAMVQNSFANTSSSIVIAKVQGSIVDVLMPPLNANELTFGYVLGGATRGVLVGLCVGLAMWVFVPIRIHDPVAVIYFAVMGSLMLSLLGMIGGIWSEKFDHIAAVTNFVITPLSFLSGTFYTIDRLPETGRVIAQLNPFFYMIDGVRYGFIGHADAPLATGAVVMLAINVLLWALTHRMFATGYRLKD